MSNLEVHDKQFRSHSGDDSEQILISFGPHAMPLCIAVEQLDAADDRSWILGSGKFRRN